MKRLLFLLLLAGWAGVRAEAAEWQWRVATHGIVSAETGREPDAYLWIPPTCERVRAVVVGQHNMSEETLFENQLFRQRMAELDFAIVWITPILDISCYLLAFRFLGIHFIKISLISTLFVSAFYKVWEQFPPMLPDLSGSPILAALLGGAFVGVGVGLIIHQGGSSGGDDALALCISHVSHWKLSFCYLFTDLSVLLLSLSYIPARRIAFSLITVTVSSFIIDIVKSFPLKKAPSA